MIDTFIPAPTGGVYNAGPLQTQPRGTLFESVNFWPLDAATGRRVLATRPPLAAFATPGENINLFAPVSGDATQTPQRTMIAASDGDLYYWDGDEWVEIVSSEAITTGRQVFAASYLKRAVIFNDTTPLVFNYDDLTLADFVATEGTVPPDCRFGVTWRGGLWIAGALEQPQVVSGSRTGDIFDWDFSQTDTAAAFQFVGESEGLIGEPVTALIPMSSDVMLVAWVDGMSMLRGHPRRGGILEPISSKIGVMGQGAWTQGPDFRVYFMSREGLATVESDGSAPSLISRQRIPSELIGLPYDYTSPNINLEYDVRYGGIHITVGGANAQAWFYDLTEGGFHRMSLPEIPTTTTRFDSLETEAASGVLLGGAAGINRFDTTASEDFFSQAIIGPLPLSKTAMTATRIEAAQFHFLSGTTYDATGAVLLRAGADGDDAVARYQANSLARAYQTTLAALQKSSGRVYPKIAGNAMTVELYGAGADHRIVFEGLSLQGAQAGRNLIPAVDSASDDPLNEAVTIGFPWLLGGLYATATGGAPTVQTARIPVAIDLSEMPSEWWDRVSSDGADIRVTTTNNALLPHDLVEFDYADQTGFLIFRRQLAASTNVVVRVWCGNASAVAPAAASAFGRHNAYHDDTIGFWPSGAGADRTGNQRDMGMLPVDATASGEPGLFAGASATRYESAYSFSNFNYEFDSTVTAGDPGAGKFRFNNAAVASATALYISKTDADGIDRSADFVIASGAFDSAFSLQSNDSTCYLLANSFDGIGTWTDNTTYYTVTFTARGTAVENSDEFTNGEECRVGLATIDLFGLTALETIAGSATFAEAVSVTALTLFDARQRYLPNAGSQVEHGLSAFDSTSTRMAGVITTLTPPNQNGDTQEQDTGRTYHGAARQSLDATARAYQNPPTAWTTVAMAMTLNSNALFPATAIIYRNGAELVSGDLPLAASFPHPTTFSIDSAYVGARYFIDDSFTFADPQTPVQRIAFCVMFSAALSAAEISLLDSQTDPASFWGAWSVVMPS